MKRVGARTLLPVVDSRAILRSKRVFRRLLQVSQFSRHKEFSKLVTKLQKHQITDIRIWDLVCLKMQKFRDYAKQIPASNSVIPPYLDAVDLYVLANTMLRLRLLHNGVFDLALTASMEIMKHQTCDPRLVIGTGSAFAKLVCVDRKQANFRTRLFSDHLVSKLESFIKFGTLVAVLNASTVRPHDIGLLCDACENLNLKCDGFLNFVVRLLIDHLESTDVQSTAWHRSLQACHFVSIIKYAKLCGRTQQANFVNIWRYVSLKSTTVPSPSFKDAIRMLQVYAEIPTPPMDFAKRLVKRHVVPQNDDLAPVSTADLLGLTLALPKLQLGCAEHNSWLLAEMLRRTQALATEPVARLIELMRHCESESMNDQTSITLQKVLCSQLRPRIRLLKCSELLEFLEWGHTRHKTSKQPIAEFLIRDIETILKTRLKAYIEEFLEENVAKKRRLRVRFNIQFPFYFEFENDELRSRIATFNRLLIHS